MDSTRPNGPDDVASGHWPSVRDSWIEADAIPGVALPGNVPPAPKSIPPALPVTRAPDPIRTDLMFERLAANDHEGALLAAQAVLARSPFDQDALECAEMAANELWKLYVNRLGSLERIFRAVVAPDALPPTLNVRAGYLLARVDGVASVNQVVENAGLPKVDALRGLTELYLCGAIRSA
jgi:hypothetical protein